jgi:drug/metabolite transporter (DMT)-like permease
MHTPDLSTRRYLLPVAALLLLALIWGYSWVVMKVALRYVQPFTFAALRASLGSVSLFLVMIVLRRPLRPRALGPTVLLGLLQTTGFMGLLTWALQDGGAGKTSVLTYTMPFWLLFMAWMALGEKLKGLQWVAAGIALGGLMLVLTPWHMRGALSEFLAIGGGIFWAAGSVYAKLLRRDHEVDLLSLTTWQMLFGSVPLLAIAAATWTGPPVWSGTFIAALVFTVVLGNAVAWVLWLYILHSFRAGTAGLAMLLTPVIGLSSAWIQLGERPGLVEGVGMLAIVVALLLTGAWEFVRGRRRKSLSRRRG